MGLEEAEMDAETQLASCVSSEDIMARLTRSPDGASGICLLERPLFAI